MIWFAFYFCCGIIFAHFIKPPFWIIYPSAFVLLAANFFLIGKDFVHKLLFPCLVFSIGIALLTNNRVLPKSHISKFITYKNDTVFAVKGFVNSQPRLADSCVSFAFAVQEAEFNRSRYKSRGGILVYLKEIKDLSYGEALILRGAMHKPFRLYSDDISAVMYVNMPGAAVRLHKNYGWPVRRFAFYIKGGIEKIIYSKLSPLAGAILDAMVLGEKKNIPAAIYDSMIKSGTVHILVVSGFNAGLVAFIIILLLKVLRLPRKARCGLAIGSLIIYCLATGSQAPVARATVMGIFFLGGSLLKREPDIRNSLALAALAILFVDPQGLFSASFQLSFVSVAAILFLYPRLKSSLGVGSLKPRFLKSVGEGCLVSLSAWLGTSGLILYYFRVFSPVTVLANIFIVPLAALITLSGFSLVIVSLIFPCCAGFFALAIELFVAALLSVNNLLIRLPFAYLYCGK